MGIGLKIKEERIRNNLSQEEVARAIGSTKQAIYKYENGIVTNIPTDKIAKMANLFGVTPSYLMGWNESDKDSSPAISDEDVKVALFGGDTEVTDEMWNEVINYAEYLKQKYKKT